MASNFKFCDSVNYPDTRVDFDDVFVRKCVFIDMSPWVWGSGAAGRLGTNSTTNSSIPVQTVASGIRWDYIAAGISHTAAIKTDGTLWLWGLGTYGRLGDNTNTSKSSAVQTVTTGNNWKQVSLGRLHSASIKTDGTLWLWGAGETGRLGNDSTTDRSSPVQTVSTGNNWKQVSLGDQHSAAIKTDGTLWLWGDGDSGILGNNSTIPHSSPVQTVSTGNNWKQVALGFYHSAAVTFTDN